ncbi:hypothetical protein [Hymenobacter sp. B81]|uniref:hypothetical protein n=1 Tax=Hymenobacter sp. B81 TaxID=3344878 RepID=UPI0037DCB371
MEIVRFELELQYMQWLHAQLSTPAFGQWVSQRPALARLLPAADYHTLQAVDYAEGHGALALQETLAPHLDLPRLGKRALVQLLLGVLARDEAYGHHLAECQHLVRRGYTFLRALTDFSPHSVPADTEAERQGVKAGALELLNALNDALLLPLGVVDERGQLLWHRAKALQPEPALALA